MTGYQYTIITYLKNPLMIFGAVLAAFVIITLGAYLILFRADEDKRSKAIKNFLYVIVAFVVLTFSLQITTSIYKTMTALNGYVSHPSPSATVDAFVNDPMGGDVGFAERMVYNIGDMIINGILFLREKIYGTSLSIKDIIFDADPNPLVNMTVPLVGGANINLYDLVMTLSGFIIFIMVVRTAYQIMRSAIDDKQGAEVRESLYRWISIPVMVMLAPMFFLALTKAVGATLSMLNSVSFAPTYVDIYALKTSDYGFGMLIAKFYMLYIEFKMWTMMFYRKVVINALYIITPLAIVLTGHPKEFDSFNVVLSTMVKFLFYPFYYGISYIIVMLVLQSMPNGSNFIVIIVGLGFVFKVVDIIILVFTVKKQVHSDNTGGLGNGAGLVSASLVAATALTRSMRSSSSALGGARSMASSVVGGAQNKSVVGGAMSMARTGATNFAKNTASRIGINGGMITGAKQVASSAKNIAAGVGKVAGSSPVMAGMAMGAGLAMTAATGNPAAGIMAGMNLGSLHKGVTGKIGSSRMAKEQHSAGLSTAEENVSHAQKGLDIEKSLAGKKDLGNIRGIHNAEGKLEGAKKVYNTMRPAPSAVASSDVKNHGRT